LKDILEKLKLEHQKKAFIRKHKEEKNPLVQGGEDAAVKEKRDYIKSVRKTPNNIIIKFLVDL